MKNSKLQRLRMKACNNCDWIGYEEECVHLKHLESVKLCPECNETTFTLTPSFIVDLVRDNERVVKLEEVVKAVAHIGVDFGYGKYEIQEEDIKKARELLDS